MDVYSWCKCTQHNTQCSMLHVQGISSVTFLSDTKILKAMVKKANEDKCASSVPTENKKEK